MGLRGEGSHDVTLIILDAGHEERLGAYAIVGECGIGTHHLTHRDVARAEAERGHGLYVLVTYAKLMYESLERIGVELAHEVSRYPVVRLRQSPA